MSPATAFVSAGIALIDRLAPVIAVSVGLYWVYLLIRRWRSDEDPSYRKFSSSALGSMSFLVSGAYASMVLASVIVVVTWPLAIDQPLVGAFIAAGVVFHAALEKNEDMEAAS